MRYTQHVRSPAAVLQHLHAAYNGISQTPSQAYIDACVGQLNNSQTAFYPHLEEGIREYTKAMYAELAYTFESHEWEMPWSYKQFHESVREGFWRLNLP